MISYPAVLQVANDDLSLRPGMTGTADITTLTHEDVLLVPNAALRFSPSPQTVQKRSGSIIGSLMPRPPATTRKTTTVSRSENGMQQIWILRDGAAVPLEVTVGATNGRVTEILDGALEAGMNVITEIETAAP